MFSVVSIAVGDDPDLTVLGSISEFLFTVPDGGTYSDAVDDAVAGVANFYNGFYLVDYKPTVIEGSSVTYAIQLVGNSSAA